MDNTTVIVLGDHSQRDAHTIVYLNKYLADAGLIDLKNGQISDYRVICKSCDGSAYLYLNPKYKNDLDILEKITDVINAMKMDERLGIQEIYSGEEALELGADGNCLVMIEGKSGYYFLEETEVLTEMVSETENHKMFAIHGCNPKDEELITFFTAFGKGIKAGARPEAMNLWDEGPTIAKLMGWKLPGADGKVIESILS